MKKMWPIALLVIVLGVSLMLSACSKDDAGGSQTSESPVPTETGGKNNEGGKETTPPAKGETEAPEAQTLTFLNYSNPSWPYTKDWPVWDYIREATGVTLDVQLPSGNLLEDAISLAIASGEMPDLMFIQSKSSADKFGQTGALVNLLDYVELMPNFKAWMEQYPTETRNTLSADGKMYMTPNEGIGETNRRIWMYREDVFAKHQLEVPQTWDELYEVLKALKAEYPDSYPLSFRNGLRFFYDFGATFNVAAEIEADRASVMLDDETGEWQYAPVKDEYKQMLQYFHKFYNEGLIPKDFLTIDTKMWQDMMSTDRAFVTLDYIGRIDFYNAALRPANPDFNLNYMPPPAGWEGGPRKSAYTQISEEGFMIPVTSEKIEESVVFLDFFFSEEGRQLASWGKEGVTSINKQFIETYSDVADLRKKTGLSTDGAYIWFDYDAHISISSPELKIAYEEAPKYDSQPVVSIAFTPEEQQILSTRGDSLNSNRDENISKFILGTRSFDEWDRFVDEQHKLGYEDIVAIYKNAHDRALQVSQ